MCCQTRPEKSVQPEPNNKLADLWPRIYSLCPGQPTPNPPVVHRVLMTGKRTLQDPSLKQAPAYQSPWTASVPSLQRAYRSLILPSPSGTRNSLLQQNAGAGQPTRYPKQWSSYLSSMEHDHKKGAATLLPMFLGLRQKPYTIQQVNVRTQICRHLLVTG